MEVILFAGTVVMVLLVLVIIVGVVSHDKLRRDIKKQHNTFTHRVNDLEGLILNEFKNILYQLKK